MVSALLLVVVGAVTAAVAADAPADDGGQDAKAPKRVVAILPLAAEGTVTAKQARGVAAQLRTASEVLVAEDLVRLLPSTKDDDNAVRRCGPASDGFDGCVDEIGRAHV